jgi:chromosomal replication initiation ATPase DnaA
MKPKKVPQAYAIPGIELHVPKINKDPKLCSESILNIIGSIYNVPSENILRHSRVECLVYVRHLYWYLMRDIFKAKVTLEWLGKNPHKNFGHTNVRSGIQSFKYRLDANSKVPIELKSTFPFTVLDYDNTKIQIIQWLQQI